MSVSAVGTGTFNRTWRGQYRRMQRTFERLYGIREKTNVFDAGEIEDGYIHFFQNAWHLKDWLRKDPESAKVVSDIENFVNGSPALQLAADLANGLKHLGLDRRKPRTGDASTGIRHMSFSGDPTVGLDMSIHVESGGKVIDATILAKDIMIAWNEYLASKGLKP